MRKTLIAMTAAAAVLVIGGALGAVAQTEGETDTDDTTVTETARPVWGHLIASLLDEMVEDGVIDADLADDIAAWLEDRRTEFAAEREAMRAAFEAAWEDGVLTEDEVADFPFVDRLLAGDGPFAEAWADGQLTREEFDAVKAEFPRRRGPHHRGGLFGSGLADGPNA